MSWPKANKDRQSTGLVHMGTKLDSIHDMDFRLGIAIKQYRKNWYIKALLLDFRTIGHITRYTRVHNGDFQLLDLIILELKSHMTCYNSIPLIG